MLPKEKRREERERERVRERERTQKTVEEEMVARVAESIF